MSDGSCRVSPASWLSDVRRSSDARFSNPGFRSLLVREGESKSAAFVLVFEIEGDRKVMHRRECGRSRSDAIPSLSISIVKFLHTADWQLGKPFARISDVGKRSLVRQERFNVVRRIGEVAKAHGAEFVIVAGDLFDSPTADKSTVSSACSAIGQLGLPVYVIPGNHDHGGAGGIWDQEFFVREQSKLAPNLHVLLKAEPVGLEQAWLLPCPLLRRAESGDATGWLRQSGVILNCECAKPRIVIAHGSTTDFGGSGGEEEGDNQATNRLELARLPMAELDYIALGDWHGTHQAGEKAWYPGTPENDRFPKGGDHDPGNVLVVELERGGRPQVTPVRTARLGWHELHFDFSGDASLGALQDRLQGMIGQRAGEDLLLLELTGSLGVEASMELEHVLESLESRLLRLKLRNQTAVAPSEAEILALTQRPGDPLISSVSRKLLALSQTGDEAASTARIALRELHRATGGR